MMPSVCFCLLCTLGKRKGKRHSFCSCAASAGLNLAMQRTKLEQEVKKNRELQARVQELEAVVQMHDDSTKKAMGDLEVLNSLPPSVRETISKYNQRKDEEIEVSFSLS